MVVVTLPVTSLQNNLNYPAKVSTSCLTSKAKKFHSPLFIKCFPNYCNFYLLQWSAATSFTI